MGPVKLAFGGVIEKEGGKGGESSMSFFKFSGSDDIKGDEKKEKKEIGDKERKEKEEGEGKKDAGPVFSSEVEGNKGGRPARL